MSKITTGQLDYTRLNGGELLVNHRFLRVVTRDGDPVVTTSGVWLSNYKINTNLHLNHYGAQYNYFRYYVSISSNRYDGWGDRHKYWFGAIKFAHKVGIDNVDNTAVHTITTNSYGYCTINVHSSYQGVWYLNFTLATTERTDEALVILH